MAAEAQGSVSPSWDARSETGRQVTPEPRGYLRTRWWLWTFEELKTFSASPEHMGGGNPNPSNPREAPGTKLDSRHDK